MGGKMAERGLDENAQRSTLVRSGSSTKSFARKRELYKEERRMRDLLTELLFSGMKKVNLSFG
jgi:hypothetical protein